MTIMKNNNRIINKYKLNEFDILKYKSKGLTPYYFKYSDNGKWLMIEAKSGIIPKDITQDRIYLLTEDEILKANEFLDKTNSLVSAYVEKIGLLKDLFVGVLIEKIITKD